jgi:cytidylate kinase
MAATMTVRVRPHTRDRLNRLAQADHISVPELLDRLVEREEQERLLKAMNHDFECLRSDETAWAEFKADTARWDATSADTGADA